MNSKRWTTCIFPTRYDDDDILKLTNASGIWTNLVTRVHGMSIKMTWLLNDSGFVTDMWMDGNDRWMNFPSIRAGQIYILH